MTETKIVTNSTLEVNLAQLSPSKGRRAKEAVTAEVKAKSSPSYLVARQEVKGADIGFTLEETQKLQTVQAILDGSNEILTQIPQALQDVPPEDIIKVLDYSGALSIMYLVTKVCVNSMKNQGNLQMIHAQLMQIQQKDLDIIQKKIGEICDDLQKTTKTNKSKKGWGLGLLIVGGVLALAGIGALACGGAEIIAFKTGLSLCTVLLGGGLVMATTGGVFLGNSTEVDQGKLTNDQVQNNSLSWASEGINNIIQMLSRIISNVSDGLSQNSNYIQKMLEMYSATTNIKLR